MIGLAAVEDTRGPFVRLEDETSRQARRERERQLRALLQARPTEEQLRPVGEPSLKAARVLGEAKLATKSAAGLAFFGDDGQFNAQAVRRANRELLEERRRRISALASAVEASLGKPSQEQLDYPAAARKRPVSVKALALLGDEGLAKAAKMQMPPDAEARPKALKFFGSASDLAPPKARKILGPSDEDGEARAMADRHWLEEMQKKKDDFIREVITRKPSESLGRIHTENGPLPAKVLEFFGDEELRRRSLRACKVRAPPKAIRVLGEADLAGSKAAALIGGDTLQDAPLKRQPVFSPLLNYRKLFRYAVGEN